jgi:hypothetical protein
MVDRERARFGPRLWPLTALALLLAVTATAAVTGLRAEDGPGGPPQPPPTAQPVPVQVATQFFVAAPAAPRFQ